MKRVSDIKVQSEIDNSDKKKKINSFKRGKVSVKFSRIVRQHNSDKGRVIIR